MTPQPPLTELHLVEWDHPRLGRISEVACIRHERQILAALRTLGIGCGGTMADPQATCLRCRRDGTPPHVFLREMHQ